MKSISSSLETPFDVKLINWFSSLLFGVFAFLIILNGFQYIAKYDMKNLDAITIKGNVVHTDIPSIRNSVTNNVNGNFYSIDLKNTKRIFESTPWVKLAAVKRVYPSQLEVYLSEYKPMAIWGAREDMKLIDDVGTIFDANDDEYDYESLPQLIGPEGQGKLMLEMFKEVSSVLSPFKNSLKNLELNARGSWIATLDGGAHIELGRGNTVDVLDRLIKFSSGAEKMLTKLSKKSTDIQYVDLRHSDGYAMRMQGVSTVDSTLPIASLKK